MGQEKALHLGPVLQWTPNWYKGTKVVLALNKGSGPAYKFAEGLLIPAVMTVCIHGASPPGL